MGHAIQLLGLRPGQQEDQAASAGKGHACRGVTEELHGRQQGAIPVEALRLHLAKEPILTWGATGQESERRPSSWLHWGVDPTALRLSGEQFQGPLGALEHKHTQPEPLRGGSSGAASPSPVQQVAGW